MDWASVQDSCRNAREGAEQVGFPRHAGLPRQDAPQEGAIKHPDDDCGAQCNG